ncbi:hypothetical protein Mame01_20270 [Microbispora amethystogenes]|nr:hypothetical protein Mame01_20270 [Microbispora amethystogenes]
MRSAVPHRPCAGAAPGAASAGCGVPATKTQTKPVTTLRPMLLPRKREINSIVRAVPATARHAARGPAGAG